MYKKTPQINICLFGITRSLNYTHKSIIQNIIEPAQKVGKVKIFAHFFDQKTIKNVRSNENNSNNREYTFFDYNEVILEEPRAIDDFACWPKIERYGDAWQDNWQSTQNLLHQLSSLYQVSLLSCAEKPDLVLYIRPDLKYHKSFKNTLKSALSQREKSICWLPKWQSYWGLNDRFSVCSGDASKIYGQRFSQISDFVSENECSLHSENFLKFVMSKTQTRVKNLNITASRVRSNHVQVEEDFSTWRYTQPFRFVRENFLNAK